MHPAAGMAKRPRPDPASLCEASGGTLVCFRTTMATLDTMALAALLRELGIVLYNREILRWRVLTDISDELIDVATLPARVRLTERLLVTPPRKPLAKRHSTA
jgi:hypothetical protein